MYTRRVQHQVATLFFSSFFDIHDMFRSNQWPTGPPDLAGKFNDEQLRNQALKLSDPYEQRNLIWVIPDGAKLLDIINVYSFEQYPRKKAFCVACGGHRHKRGFTAVLITGERLLFGSLCGSKAFGQSWTEAERRIEERGDRQFELKKLDRLATMISALESGVISWQRPMEHLAGKRSAFDRHLGELASRVREAVQRRGGALTVFRKIENRAARSGGMTSKSAADHQEVTVARLGGVEFFDSLDPAKAIVDASVAIDGCRALLGKTDGFSLKQLRDARRKLESSLTDLETCAKIHAGAEEFFTVSNFEAMIQWANEHGATQARYVFEENDIVRAESREGGIQVRPPAPIETMLLDLIKDYRRAD